jgi:hypothetical protein
MGIQDTYCYGLEQKLDVAIAALESIDKTIKGPLKALQNLLEDYADKADSLIDDINDGVGSLQDAIKLAIPDPPDGKDLQNVLDKCLGLKVDFEIESPAGIIGKVIGSIGDILISVLEEAFNLLAGLIEFPIAKLIDFLNGLLSNINISDLLSELGGFIDCLEALCGSDIASKIDTIESLLANMKVSDSGRLNTGTLYSDAGLSQNKIINITFIVDQLEESKSEAAVSIENIAKKLKTEVKSLKKQIVGKIEGKIDIPFA